MNMQELKELIYQGEKVDIECKKAEKNVPKSAYESYSAFANTKGGYIILGVREDKTKTDPKKRFIIQGIEDAPKQKEDFWNTLDQQHGSIICPCCGREMSLQYSTSYRLKFTPNTCSIMNHQLELYRQTIFMIENSLRRHNSREINYYSKDTCYSVDQENMQSDGSINSPIAEKVSKFIGELNM